MLDIRVSGICIQLLTSLIDKGYFSVDRNVLSFTGQNVVRDT